MQASTPHANPRSLHTICVHYHEKKKNSTHQILIFLLKYQRLPSSNQLIILVCKMFVSIAQPEIDLLGFFLYINGGYASVRIAGVYIISVAISLLNKRSLFFTYIIDIMFHVYMCIYHAMNY